MRARNIVPPDDHVPAVGSKMSAPRLAVLSVS